MGMSNQIPSSRLIQPGVITNASERPASPFEGQYIYQTDTNQTFVYDGSAWIITAQSGAWLTWSPTYTNLTIGNGSVIARYTQIGKTVNFVFDFTLGSTSSVGTAPVISLPVAGATSFNSWFGTSRYLDSGVTNYVGAIVISSTGIRPQVVRTTGTYAEAEGGVTATAPMTWAVNDVMSLSGIYEAS